MVLLSQSSAHQQPSSVGDPSKSKPVVRSTANHQHEYEEGDSIYWLCVFGRLGWKGFVTACHCSQGLRISRMTDDIIE